MRPRKVLYLQTLWRLGLRNVWDVAWYRLRLRLGVHPVQRVRRVLKPGPFFTPPKAAVSALSPPAHWRENARYFGWYEPGLEATGAAPDWHRNPFNDARMANVDVPWWQLSDFDTGIGDIKNVWEASRFDWVLAFAQQAAAGEAGALDRLNQWITDWCGQNPCYQGPNWKCAQEASIRVMHLAVAARLLGQEQSSSSSLLALVEAHLARIRPTLAYARAQDNNHGTSEAAALYIGGHWLENNGMPDGASYAQVGRRYLEERVQRLVAKDGTFSQYSVNYHRLMLDTLSLVECWRRWLDLPLFSSDYRARAVKAARWLYAMVDPDTGDAPNLGANDGAHLLSLTDADYRDYRPSVQLALALFANERGYEVAGLHQNHLAWLGVAEPKQPAPPACSSQLDDGGYAVLRSGPWRAVFRYPRYRFRPSHCDALHVDLWHDGRNVLRDGGSYSYNAEDHWRRYFAGPAAHNTIEFDGRDPMPVLGRFLRGAWLKAEAVSCALDGAEAQTAQAAYTDWQSARHFRQVSLGEEGLIVRDAVSGFGEKAVLRWRLIPGDWVLMTDGVQSTEYLLRITADMPIERMALLEGWESRYYLHKNPIPVLEVEVTAPGTIKTLLAAAPALQ